MTKKLTSIALSRCFYFSLSATSCSNCFLVDSNPDWSCRTCAVKETSCIFIFLLTSASSKTLVLFSTLFFVESPKGTDLNCCQLLFVLHEDKLGLPYHWVICFGQHRNSMPESGSPMESWRVMCVDVSVQTSVAAEATGASWDILGYRFLVLYSWFLILDPSRKP